MMKTVKLTNEELATLKSAVLAQIQSIEKEIKWAKEDGENIDSLVEIREQYQNAFEALNFAE
ncbi:MAG: hypothetical protein C6W54_11130 [Bacillaceae bacterium]|nr:MAG: hypothetical protein C6W54_11130 [Bacillaceae bacterium]